MRESFAGGFMKLTKILLTLSLLATTACANRYREVNLGKTQEDVLSQLNSIAGAQSQDATLSKAIALAQDASSTVYYTEAGQLGPMEGIAPIDLDVLELGLSEGQTFPYDRTNSPYGLFAEMHVYFIYGSATTDKSAIIFEYKLNGDTNFRHKAYVSSEDWGRGSVTNDEFVVVMKSTNTKGQEQEITLRTTELNQDKNGPGAIMGLHVEYWENGIAYDAGKIPTLIGVAE